MRKLLASVLLAGLSLYLVACGGGSSNNGGSGGNGGSSGGGTPPPVTLTSITVTTSTPSIAPGTTAQFTAQGKYSDNTTKNLTSQVTWSSSATSVATVNFNGVAGLAKGLAGGTASITGSMNGVSGSATLTVTSASLVSINVTPANPSINVGTQQQFTATGSFSDGTTQDISNVVAWSSSPSGIASITSRSGLATGNSTGTATVTATFTAGSTSIQGSTQLTVTLANLISLAIAPATPKIAMNTSQSFTATGTFQDGSTHNLNSLVTWSSSNTSVAIIAPHSASAFGVAPGNSTITATTGSISASIVLTVTNATLVSIAIAPAGVSIPAGVIVNLSATGTFSDQSTQVLTVPCNWASQNTSVATVNNSGGSSGITTAISPGSATITATAPAALGSIVGSTTVTVNSATLKSIAVTGNALIAPGRSVQYQATGTYSDSSTHSITNAVTWVSSNKSVATVSSNGVVSAQGAGTATITATQNGISGSQGLVVTSSQVTSITISSTNSSPKVAEATSVQLTATGTFADGTTQNLTSVATWTSSNPAIATVSRNGGVVTGVAPGTVNVTAAFNGIGGSLNNLQVTNAVLTQVTISPSAPPSITLGSFLQFSATGTFNDGTKQVLTNFSTWNTSNAGVAIVNRFGLATTSGTGTTTITVTATQNATTVSDSATLTVQ
jgi:uncharacterized protein YjdB